MESYTIDYHSQDIIPKQLLDFWKKELYRWRIIIMGDREITLNYIIPDVPVVFFSLSPDLQTPNNGQQPTLTVIWDMTKIRKLKIFGIY